MPFCDSSELLRTNNREEEVDDEAYRHDSHD
jgi:hypothetical protein